MDTNGVVTRPGSTKVTLGTPARFSQGQQGEQFVRQLGGRYAALAQDGNLFLSNTLVAGVTVPAPATTLASKAGWVNPLGALTDMELIGLGLSSVTIEVALKNFALEFQLNASQTGGVPTSITKLTANSMPLGAGRGSANGFAYTAATMTNAAANTIVLPLFGNYETAVGYDSTWFSLADMGLFLAPDSVVAITNVAALAAVQVVYLWAEHPRSQ